MSIELLVGTLASYLKRHPNAQPTVDAFKAFLTDHPNGVYRTCLYGHLTASSWVINHDQSAFLLLHHKKLNKWIQPGGHADGNWDLQAVALKEAKEESGLQSLFVVDSTPLHISIYNIPAYKDTPSHLHFDVCYAIQASEDETLMLCDEAHAMAWFYLPQQPATLDEDVALLMNQWLSIRQRQQQLP